MDGRKEGKGREGKGREGIRRRWPALTVEGVFITVELFEGVFKTDVIGGRLNHLEGYITTDVFIGLAW